jgi:hypothetical protein
MKVMRLGFLTILLVINYIYLFGQENGDTLYWSSNRKLKWSDFQSSVSKNKIYSNVSAVTVSSIRRSIQQFDYEVPDYFVIAYFNKRESWTKDTNSFNLLNHEQGHFDIIEVRARMIRQEIQKLKNEDNFDLQDYEDAIAKITAQNDSLNDKYDLETRHGTDYEAQSKWNGKIAVLLKELNQFEFTYNCYFKH